MSTHYSSLNHWAVVSVYLAGLSSLLILSGCTMGPDYERPEADTPGRFVNSESSGPPMAVQWRELFQSPQLSTLLNRAEANNRTLKAAYQSVLASQAVLDRFRADGRPQVDAGLGADFFNNSDALAASGRGDNGERYDADLRIGWELDLFGRIRRSIQAAAADAEAQEALYTDFLITLQADVARHYFEINSLQAEIELLERSRQTRQESLDLIQQRFRTGTVSELDVAQTTTLLANAESRLFEVRRIQNSLIYSLAALLGETPSTFTFEPSPLTELPPPVPNGLPGELLERRPDIRRAERQLAADSERIGVAKASFFPSITLQGTAGFASRHWDDLFSSDAAFDSIRPGVSIPIFEGGRLRANEAVALANYHESLELYQQRVIDAVTEVEDFLQSIQLLESQRQAIDRSVTASNQAREISMLQYQRGISDFITALDAERTALNAEQQFVQVKRAQYIATINLIRALGGSW